MSKIETNSKKQSGMNQMGKKKINKKMESTKNQFEQNMNNFNQMMSQNMSMIQGNVMDNPMMNQNMSKYDGNMMSNQMMSQNMSMNQGNMIDNPMLNQNMNMNNGNMMSQNMKKGNNLDIMNIMMINMNQMNKMLNTNLNKNNCNCNCSNCSFNSDCNCLCHCSYSSNNCNCNCPISEEYGFIIILFITNQNRKVTIQVRAEEKVSEMIEKYRSKACDHDMHKEFIFNSKQLNPSLTVQEAGITNLSHIFVYSTQGIPGGGGAWYNKEINIKFIKSPTVYDNKISNCQLNGLLKLCLLKEISSKLNDDKLIKLPKIINCIMRILKNGYIETGNDIKETIKEVLLKVKGSNIINFSEYVDETIDTNQIDKMINLLDNNDLKDINDIRFRLSKYNKIIKFFMKKFDQAKKESIFEFSVISLVEMEREDFEKFKKERKLCPNRVDKILYHGTSITPISCILTEQFKKSLEHYQHGKGVYFTDFLDYCWFYGGEKSNRANQNIIPRIDDTFSLIACHVYYNKERFRKVTNSNYTPKKNEINFAYADANFDTVKQPDFNKFVGTEYIIWDLDQICPFISAKLKRNEYCVIWRDNNFSSDPVYNNEYDEIFKKFLNERIKYIKQMAKYNIYPCETSEEALKLVERKKYNKIILISNVGTDLGGKKFVEKARKIIGNDIIALFLAYNIAHLKWIKDYKNALFSNDPKFYEEYLQCFDEKNSIKENLESLKNKMEEHYDVKFTFDDKFLDYPQFKDGGNYSDLSFNN